MRTLLLPEARTGVSLPAPLCVAAVSKTSSSSLRRPLLRFNCAYCPHSSLSALKSLKGLSSPYLILTNQSRKTLPSAPIAAAYSSPGDDSAKAKFVQVSGGGLGDGIIIFASLKGIVSKRLETTSRHFKRLGSFGFWGQLVCTFVAAVIVAFSNVISGKITSRATFYATTGGIAAAFISVFWSFGYIRLSDKLKSAASDPSKAPPRMDLVRSLKYGIVVNLLGMCAAIFGMQATVGALVAKALTTSSNPYYQGTASNPVLALDVFLVQASANTVLSHFLGLICSLELLRSVTSPERVPIPNIA